MFKRIDMFIKDISEPTILSLLDELEKVTKVKRSAFSNSRLYDYIYHCVYPNGAGTEQVPINKRKLDSTDDFSDTFFLRKQIKQLDPEIYFLCNEIANVRRHSSIEQASGKRLYVFLNEYLKEAKKKKKKKPRNYLWR